MAAAWSTHGARSHQNTPWLLWFVPFGARLYDIAKDCVVASPRRIGFRQLWHSGTVRRSGTRGFFGPRAFCLDRRLFVTIIGVAMLRNVHDAFAKNLLHAVFSLRGLAQTEAEVPPGNAMRLDLWFVPELDKPLAEASEFVGILATLTSEPTASEIWSGVLSVDEFFMGLVKRELWHGVLEERENRPWPRPTLWHICAGKPQTVLRQFGYVAAGVPGWYTSLASGLLVQIVVVSELPKTRETLLLRLLGRKRVRCEALTELGNLPEDAWEKQVANRWLIRVRLEVKVDQVVTPEDREFVMDINAWYKEFIETHDREVKAQVLRELEPKLAKERRKERRKGRSEGQREGQRKAEINQLVHLFQRRVGRSLSADERQTLTACVKKFGPEHLMDLVLDSSGPELAAWLETNGLARND